MSLRRFAHRLAIEQGRLDDSLGDLGRLLRAGNDKAARRRLARFTARFDRYVLGEERILFPILEARAPTPFAPTARMRSEHGFLRRLLATLRDALDGGDRRRGLRVLVSLRSVLAVHHAKEEWVIYPLLAASLTPATETRQAAASRRVQP